MNGPMVAGEPNGLTGSSGAAVSVVLPADQHPVTLSPELDDLITEAVAMPATAAGPGRGGERDAAARPRRRLLAAGPARRRQRGVEPAARGEGGGGPPPADDRRPTGFTESARSGCPAAFGGDDLVAGSRLGIVRSGSLLLVSRGRAADGGPTMPTRRLRRYRPHTS